MAAREEQQLAKLDVTADMVKARLAVLGFQDVRRLFDANNNLLPMTGLPPDVAAQIGRTYQPRTQDPDAID